MKRRLRSSVMVTMIVATGAQPALAEGEPQVPAPADPSALPLPASPIAQERARALFDRGKVHYTLGEYDEAIVLFREAYELTAAPILLFNIAQGHRLKGDCVHALEVYRHFVRISPGAPLAAEARTHIDALSSTCAPEPREQPAPAHLRERRQQILISHKSPHVRHAVEMRLPTKVSAARNTNAMSSRYHQMFCSPSRSRG